VRTALACAFAAFVGQLPVAATTAADAPVPHTSGLASKKGGALEAEARPLFATLVQTHTDERVLLDAESPSEARFSALLHDHVTGGKRPLDGRLLDLLRRLAEKHATNGEAVRIELVSGYRSEKLNEMLRKKGHHVASKSQHSLGHAVDFRIVLPGAEKGVDPRQLEREIRELGWKGGVGVYLLESDWFVHADVGPQRGWYG
jgi:uncharacterized protein YcbK (DUF882 family)